MGAGETRAVIDVGTNSVKVLIGAVDGGTVTPLHEESNQTRLGQGFYETHILQPSPIDSTARAVAEYAELARHFGEEVIYPGELEHIALAAGDTLRISLRFLSEVGDAV